MFEAQTVKEEKHITAMVAFIQSQDNPFKVDNQTSKLHNIFTKEVMSEEIISDTLKFRENGLQMYSKFWKEQFLDKTSKLSDTISRRNLKTFNSIHIEKKKSNVSCKKMLLKESHQAQKQMDLALERGLNMKEVFKFDHYQHHTYLMMMVDDKTC